MSALIKVSMKNHTLRSISTDKVHLFSQHGSSFRSEIRMVGKELFVVIFNGNNIKHPFIIVAIAKMTLSDLSTFSAITSVVFPLEY